MLLSSSLRKSLLTLGVALPLATGAAFAQTGAPPADPSKVVARVNGAAITEGDLAVAADDPALQLPNVPEAQKRDLLTGYMIDLKLGAKAAEAAKVGSGAEFARKLVYNRDKTLLDEYLEQESKKAVTPEAARKLYDETVKSVPAEQEVRARHILVENEDDAKKIAARVKGGEDFAKVAGELSTDPGSKTDGGDLGFFTKDRMVEPFAEAAFKLEPGQVSDPVKSQFGWHLVKLVDSRETAAPSLEQARPQIEDQLRQEALQAKITELKASAEIEVPEGVVPPAAIRDGNLLTN